jgi:hypothetical protein
MRLEKTHSFRACYMVVLLEKGDHNRYYLDNFDFYFDQEKEVMDFVLDCRELMKISGEEFRIKISRIINYPGEKLDRLNYIFTTMYKFRGN